MSHESYAASELGGHRAGTGPVGYVETPHGHNVWMRDLWIGGLRYERRISVAGITLPVGDQPPRPIGVVKSVTRLVTTALQRWVST